MYGDLQGYVMCVGRWLICFMLRSNVCIILCVEKCGGKYEINTKYETITSSKH